MKKLTIEEVKKDLETHGFILLDEEYINISLKLNVKDIYGYKYYIPYNNLKQSNYNPKKFCKTNIYTIENIKNYIKINKINCELLSTEYINNSNKLLFKCQECDNEFRMNWNHFLRGQRCPKCGKKKSSEKQAYSIEYYKSWIKDNRPEYELIGATRIKNDDTILELKCSKGHIFKIRWANFKVGNNCSYCTNKKVLEGYNDIATVAPWMIKLGVSEEDAKKYTCQSSKEIEVICPSCGEVKKTRISTIYACKSIGCTCQSSSYAEKIMISILEQLNLKYIKEFKPNWCKFKHIKEDRIIQGRYDFMIEDLELIIEMDGGFHFQDNTLSGQTKEDSQYRDIMKDKLAEEHGYKIIRIDCNYSNIRCRFEYIKNSILNSELSQIFNLKNVNWKQVEMFATGIINDEEN